MDDDAEDLELEHISFKGGKMTLRVRRAKKVTLVPEAVGDVVFAYANAPTNTIDPAVAANDTLGTFTVNPSNVDTLSSFTITPVPSGTDKFTVSQVDNRTYTLKRSASGTLTDGVDESVRVDTTDSQLRTFNKTFTFDIEAPEAPPAGEVATTISPNAITITTSQSGDIGVFSITDGSPAVFTAIVDGGTDAAIFSETLLSDTTFKVTLSAAQSAGTKNFWVKVTNSAGQSGEIAITVTVVSSEAFATPTDPFSANAITLGGAFPTTVTASNVGAIPQATAIDDWADLTATLTAAGGSISVTVPAGTQLVAGGVGNVPGGFSLISPKGTYSPFATDKGPTSYLINNTSAPAISSGAAQTDANAHFFVQGFVLGPALSRLNQDQAYEFESGGTYQIQVDDVVTGASSGVTATVMTVHLDSGAWAAGTAFGRLVLKSRSGTFTNNENLNVGANLNVATLTDNIAQYGPRVQKGDTCFTHQGQGKFTFVSCYFRNAPSDNISTISDVSIANPTPRVSIYDCLTERGGNSNQTHNVYAHRQIPLEFIRSASINPGGGGHALKAEVFSAIVLDSYLARDHGELDTICDDTITVTSGTQVLNLDGPLCSGGVATLPQSADLGYPLIRIYSTGNLTGRWFNLTGTNASDAAITDQIKGGSNNPVFSALRFKTLTAATITNVPGGSTSTGQRVFLSAGAGHPAEGQAVMDYSRSQDMRCARTLIHARSYGSGTGGRAIYSAARTSAFGGCGPKTPPISNETSIGAGGLSTPFESNGYLLGAQKSETEIHALLTTAVNSSATSVVLKRVRKFPGQTTNVTLSTSSQYRLRIMRSDGTIGEFTVTPSVSASGTATVPLGGQIGGGGAVVNAYVGLKLSSNSTDDNFDWNPRWYNRAHSTYYWDQITDSNGDLDLTKQQFFNAHYFEHVFIMNEHTVNRHLIGAAQEFQHMTWCDGTGGFLIEPPLPPGNRPQGQYSVAFTSGGPVIPVVGNTITGATSSSTAVVGGVKLSSGSWPAGTAEGTIWCTSKSGTFQAENINIGASSNVFTIAGDISMDWPDVAGAATLKGVLSSWGWGTQPSGVVNGDTLGSTTDAVYPWLTCLKNIGWHRSTKSAGTLSQFSWDAADDGPATLRLMADVRYVSSGTLVQLGRSDTNPMPVPAMTTVTTAASASASKLYLTSTSGFTAGLNVHAELPLMPGADDAMYIGTIQTVGSDGGGAFITVDPVLPRAMSARAAICAFTDAGSDPSNWVSPDEYGSP